MREIKFRAWDKVKKEWLRFPDEKLFINPETKTGRFYIHDTSNTGHDFIELRQYTDIKDKDGEEIYEGSIVNSWEGLDLEGPQGHGQYWRTVVRDEEEPRLRFEPATGSTLCKNNQKHFKVIGNTDENSELLHERNERDEK